MAKNITLKLDENVLHKARHMAVENDRSLSQWVADLIVHAVSEKSQFAAARRRALQRMEKGLHLRGKPLSRNQAHER